MDRKIIQHFRCLTLTAALGLLLTGCMTKDYGQSDIESFLEKEGVQQFSLSKEYREQKGDDGYTDKIWDVTAQTPDGGEISFHVIDDYHWGMESLTNYLRTDYEDALLIYCAEKCDAFEQISLETGEAEGMIRAYLVCPYDTRAEIKSGYEEVMAFQTFVEKAGVQGEYYFTVYFQMQNPLRNVVCPPGNHYEMDDGDFRMYVTSADESSLKDGEERFIRTCADYRFEDALADFTQEEIEEALNKGEHRIGVHDDGLAENEYRVLPGLSASNFSYGISFGCLYRILEWEMDGDLDGGQTLNLSGDPWHYSFTGADGAEYEISYDFHQYNEEDPEHESYYYYLKDGEVVWMDAFFYNHFRVSTVKEMTGMELAEGKAEDGVIRKKE